MLVPILEALDHEGADLAIVERGPALLDALTSALDEQLAANLYAARPLWCRRCLAKLLCRLRLLPKTERVLVVALLSPPPMQLVAAPASCQIDAVTTVDSDLLVDKVEATS
eukprot:2964-Prymnesium_polylepis.1